MNHQVMCVYDSKARVYYKPYYVSTVEVGQRAFAGAVSDVGTEVSKFPADFVLFHLGTFDDDTGRFEQLPEPVNLGHGAAYRSLSS